MLLNFSLIIFQKCVSFFILKHNDVLFIFQSSAKAYRVRTTETYKQIKALIVQDQQLMMDIIEMEEVYINKWVASRRVSLEQQIKDMDSLLSESKSLLQENDQLKLIRVP